jgi:hypothetical protein
MHGSFADPIISASAMRRASQAAHAGIQARFSVILLRGMRSEPVNEA